MHQQFGSLLPGHPLLRPEHQEDCCFPLISRPIFGSSEQTLFQHCHFPDPSWMQEATGPLRSRLSTRSTCSLCRSLSDFGGSCAHAKQKTCLLQSGRAQTWKNSIDFGVPSRKLASHLKGPLHGARKTSPPFPTLEPKCSTKSLQKLPRLDVHEIATCTNPGFLFV